MNILLIPFAGGSRYSYDFLKKYLNEIFDNIFILELSGHGSRIKEPLLENLEDIINDLVIKYFEFFKEDYIIFGHSMGATIAFLLAEKLTFTTIKPPCHLILSSNSSIDILSKSNKKRYELDPISFKNYIKKFGVIPDEIINNNDIYLFFERILRADFKALDTYNRREHIPLNIPITAIYGENDICDYNEVKSWEKFTNKDFNMYKFPGGHFYIFEYGSELADLIRKIAKFRSE